MKKQAILHLWRPWIRNQEQPLTFCGRIGRSVDLVGWPWWGQGKTPENLCKSCASSLKKFRV